MRLEREVIKERDVRRAWDSKVTRWGLPWLWMAVIFFLSAQSRLPNLTPGAPGLEEIGGHLFVFGVLALLWWRALYAAGLPHPAAWALVIAALYGMSDEYHQSFVPGRTASVADWVVDVIGASVALAGYLFWRSRQERRKAGTGARQTGSAG